MYYRIYLLIVLIMSFNYISASSGKVRIQRDAAPAHEPRQYAENHGLALETDEEGVLRAGGEQQEGYESLYFEPSTAMPEKTPPPYN